jgi:Flp pilus assembly protein TadG
MKSARQRTNERGQGMIEAAIVIVLFLTIALGVMTFGHAFMAANMITHAARDGARVAATWTPRGNCNGLNNSNTATIQAMVQSEISAVTAETFTVNVSQTPAQPNSGSNCVTSSTPTVSVQVIGCIPWLFPLIPTNFGATCPSGKTGFSVNRTVVFHDEGLGA